MLESPWRGGAAAVFDVHCLDHFVVVNLGGFLMPKSWLTKKVRGSAAPGRLLADLITKRQRRGDSAIRPSDVISQAVSLGRRLNINQIIHSFENISEPPHPHPPHASNRLPYPDIDYRHNGYHAGDDG
jgi:hypothetical protein